MKIKTKEKKHTPSLFGTDGVRGRANQAPISPELILKLGQAIGIYFKKHYGKPKIIIGKDTRLSGYLLEQALSAGICSVGVHTAFLGPLPTPGIAYMTRGLRANAGIVISASHNPYYDNGIKIFSKDGYKLPDSVEHKLEALTFADITAEHPLPTGNAIGTSHRIDDAVGQYAVFLKEQFPKHLTLDNFRIVLDCANGAAYKVAPKVFEELGAEVFLINSTPNGTNINEQCGALFPERLVEKVKLYKADIGFAFDGDADRVVVVDERGEIIDGDEILAICGIFHHKNNKLNNGTVVATIMSNLGLEIALREHGIELVRTQVGDRYVVEAMRSKNFSLGGEQSGHLIFRDSSTTGDGILASLKLLEAIIEKGQSLHSLKKCMTKYPQITKSFNVIHKPKLEQLPRLDKQIQAASKKLGNNGRVLFRYSGTEPKARIMIEGTDHDLIQGLCNELVELAVKEINGT